jgi:WD40 repeat protein
LVSLSSTSLSDQHMPSFLLAPVHGDVAIVDMSRGIQLTTIRRQVDSGSSTNKAKDIDEGMMDTDDITAFAMSSNNQLVLTCSKNGMIRQYSIHVSHTTDHDDDDDDNDNGHPLRQQQQHVNASIELVKEWGKSGHTLPCTSIRIHPSDVFMATGSVDGTCRIWDTRGCYVTHVFRPVVSTRKNSAPLSTTTSSSSINVGGLQAATIVEWLPHLTQLVVAIGRDDGTITIHNLRGSRTNIHETNYNNTTKANRKNTKRKNVSSSKTMDVDDSAHVVIILRDHMSPVISIGWDPTTSLLISAGRDAVLHMY